VYVMSALKILTWNINGIRACKIPLKRQLDQLDADVICLQETKVTSSYLQFTILI
jgi:AP endonuclease-2